MRLLLDSHVLLWWLEDHPRLRPVRDLIIEAASVYVSAATVWELGIKQRLGRLELPERLAPLLSANQFEPLAIQVAHAEAAAALPLHHADPFDRMLVAQALDHGLTIVTHDTALTRYEASLIKV